MAYLLLSETKKHLNVDKDFKDDDNYIQMLIDVAEDAVEKHIDKPLKECMKYGVLEPTIKQAILLMVGNLYANREAVTYGSAVEVPLCYQYLVGLNISHNIY